MGSSISAIRSSKTAPLVENPHCEQTKGERKDGSTGGPTACRVESSESPPGSSAKPRNLRHSSLRDKATSEELSSNNETILQRTGISRLTHKSKDGSKDQDLVRYEPLIFDQTIEQEENMASAHEQKDMAKETQKTHGKLRREAKVMHKEMSKLETRNEGLQPAAGRMANDTQKFERSLQESCEKLEFLRSEKDEWESQYSILKERSTKIEVELRSCLADTLNKVVSMTDVLTNQRLEAKTLRKYLADADEVAAAQDSEIDRLTVVIVEAHKVATAARCVCTQIKNYVKQLQKSKETFRLQNRVLEDLCVSQEEEIKSLRSLRIQLDARVKDLENSAAERIRLQQANANSCKSRSLVCQPQTKVADITIVKDFADYFTKISTENMERLETLIQLVPVERADIMMLLEQMSAREQDISITADVLRQHGRIMIDSE
jgi:hypothetical protein